MTAIEASIALQESTNDSEGNWQMFTAPDGRVYYYNQSTRESRWKLPKSLRPKKVSDKVSKSITNTNDQVRHEREPVVINKDSEQAQFSAKNESSSNTKRRTGGAKSEMMQRLQASLEGKLNMSNTNTGKAVLTTEDVPLVRNEFQSSAILYQDETVGMSAAERLRFLRRKRQEKMVAHDDFMKEVAMDMKRKEEGRTKKIISGEKTELKVWSQQENKKEVDKKKGTLKKDEEKKKDERRKQDKRDEVADEHCQKEDVIIQTVDKQSGRQEELLKHKEIQPLTSPKTLSVHSSELRCDDDYSTNDAMVHCSGSLSSTGLNKGMEDTEMDVSESRQGNKTLLSQPTYHSAESNDQDETTYGQTKRGHCNEAESTDVKDLVDAERKPRRKLKRHSVQKPVAREEVQQIQLLKHNESPSNEEQKDPCVEAKNLQGEASCLHGCHYAHHHHCCSHSQICPISPLFKSMQMPCYLPVPSPVIIYPPPSPLPSYSNGTMIPIPTTPSTVSQCDNCGARGLDVAKKNGSCAHCNLLRLDFIVKSAQMRRECLVCRGWGVGLVDPTSGKCQHCTLVSQSALTIRSTSQSVEWDDSSDSNEEWDP